MSEGIQTLGGRQYRSIHTSTLEHDIATMNAVRGAGLAELTLGPDEQPVEFAHRLLVTLLESGKIFEVLGCVLIPAEIIDLNWTPAIGKETATAMRALTDPDEKRIVQAQVASMVMGFFRSGLLSLTRSQSYSAGTEAAARNSESEVSTISETGR